MTLKVAIYEGDRPVSNSVTVSFDSPSHDMNAWQTAVDLTLEGRPFDHQGRYHLILRDADTGVEQVRHDIRIDLSVDSDF